MTGLPVGERLKSDIVHLPETVCSVTKDCSLLYYIINPMSQLNFIQSKTISLYSIYSYLCLYLYLWPFIIILSHVNFALFYFALFHLILFYFILFYFILFYFILFYFILFLRLATEVLKVVDEELASRPFIYAQGKYVRVSHIQCVVAVSTFLNVVFTFFFQSTFICCTYVPNFEFLSYAIYFLSRMHVKLCVRFGQQVYVISLIKFNCRRIHSMP